MPALKHDDGIYVSGHRGMVGSAVCRALRHSGFDNLLTINRADLDVTDQKAVFDFFAARRPRAQIICAAIVGGIVANDSYPGDFIGPNLMMQTNLLEAARRFHCGKTLFMASGCVYPRDTAQPMKETQLLTGALEPTNQWYAIAKLAGIKMGQAYRRQFGMDVVSVLPANLYGPNDNFDLDSAHVVPALMRKMDAAKTAAAPFATVWGSGRVMREFLHVDDLAAAAVFVMRQNDAPDCLNIGYGEDITIADLAALMKTVVGFTGELRYDASRPDGMARKLLDSSRLFDRGWRPRIPLSKGLAETYEWFVNNRGKWRATTHPVLRPA